MAELRHWQFVNRQVGWMLVLTVMLSLIGVLTLKLFFLGSFLGFLFLVLATAPTNLTPEWRGRLRWPIAVGVLVFLYLVVQNVIEVLPDLF